MRVDARAISEMQEHASSLINMCQAVGVYFGAWRNAVHSSHACDMGKSQTRVPKTNDGQLAQNPKQLVKLYLNICNRIGSKIRSVHGCSRVTRSCFSGLENHQAPVDSTSETTTSMGSTLTATCSDTFKESEMRATAGIKGARCHTLVRYLTLLGHPTK